MTFAQVLSRGFAAANRSPAGLLLLFLILGVQQGANVIAGSLLTPEALQVKPGEPPSPEIFALIGFGCFTCSWGIVGLFVTPWVVGGVVGQSRDRMTQPENPPVRFNEYAGRFYARMLVLALLWLAAFMAIWFVMMFAGAAIVASTVQPGQQIQPEQWQEMNRHPANIASAFMMILLMTVAGVVWSLAQAIVVVDDKGPITSFADALRFCSRQISDAFKLFLVFISLGLPLWLSWPLMAALDVENLAVRTLVAAFVATYFPYLILLELACAVSLYLARRPLAVAGTTTPSETR